MCHVDQQVPVMALCFHTGMVRALQIQSTVLQNKAGKIPAQMNARAKSLCHFLNGQSDGRNDRIAVALGELMSARPSRGSDLYWRFFHDPMGVWRWERVDSHGNVSACDRGFITYPQCLADAVWRTFGEDAPQSS